MQLSKMSYYSDFVVHPLVLVTLTAININHATWASRTEWLGAGVAGLGVWTLAGDVLHRVGLHRMAYFLPMHRRDHAAPLAPIGTPSWIRLAGLCFGTF